MTVVIMTIVGFIVCGFIYYIYNVINGWDVSDDLPPIIPEDKKK